MTFPAPQLLERMFDVLRDHVFLMELEPDGGFRLTYTNEAMCRFFGAPRESLVGKRLEEIVSNPELYQRILGRYREVIDSGRPINYEETSEGLEQAPLTVFDTQLSPMFNEAGACNRICGVSRNITARRNAEDKLRKTNEELEVRLAEIRALQQQLHQQTLRDSLTGLYNRRYLGECLERELYRAKREGYPVTLMMLDVDHFKPFNDAHGHQAGDAALKALAEKLSANMRAEDVICRFGGEEFLGLMPGITAEAARQRITDLRRQQGPLRVSHNGQNHSVHFSAGLAEYPRHATNGEDLIRKADQALYRAKHGGRDQVLVFSDGLAAEADEEKTD